MSADQVHEFDWPRPLLNANQRMHWRQRAEITRHVRNAARLAFGTFPIVTKVRVVMIWIVTTGHRRDADNTVPTLKAICDGLVDAGIVPDDTPEYMEKVMPRIERGTRARVRVEVTEVPA